MAFDGAENTKPPPTTEELFTVGESRDRVLPFIIFGSFVVGFIFGVWVTFL